MEFMLSVLAVFLFGTASTQEPEFFTCATYECPPASTCVEHDTYLSCECPPGKTGENCTLDDPCLEVRGSDCPAGSNFKCYGPCNPNVYCNGATGIPHCAGCILGWTAEGCDQDVDECRDIPDACNNGTCKNTVGDFECTCNTGWTGKRCDCKKGTKCEKEEPRDLQTKDNASSPLQSCVLLIVLTVATRIGLFVTNVNDILV